MRRRIALLVSLCVFGLGAPAAAQEPETTASASGSSVTIGASIRCVVQINNPHRSTHQPGTVNAASTCQNGTYHGVGVVSVTFPPGFSPPTANGIVGSTTIAITC